MVTVKDIAKASGVSASTVSIILNGQSERRKISQATCQKVWTAVRELGYQPNIAARTLRGTAADNTKTIALFWANDFRTSMLSRFLKGLESTGIASDTPYEIVVFTYANNQLSKQTALLSGRRFHAAIIANASQKDMEFIESVVFPMPVVLYNRFSPNHYCVTVDNYQMGCLAARAILQRGKCHPWILNAADAFPGMPLRVQGFCETLAGHDITVPEEHILCAQNTLASGNDTTKDLLRICSAADNDHVCDSIFCLSDAIAHGALFALNRAGIAIPEQISLISIGNGEASQNQFAIPPLSSVYLPMEDMAGTCLQMLLALIEHQPLKEKNVVLETPLKLLES